MSHFLVYKHGYFSTIGTFVRSVCDTPIVGFRDNGGSFLRHSSQTQDSAISVYNNFLLTMTDDDAQMTKVTPNDRVEGYSANNHIRVEKMTFQGN